jgi:polar amino acid transport system permease protein/polar amino acid transport system substrate-binding protein
VKFGLAAAAAIACLGASSRVAAADLDQVRARGELAWGGDLQGGEPYVFEDSAHPGQIRGFEVDIAAALARRLGVTARFVQTDWSSLVPSLERDDFDVILNGLEETPERRARLLLSVPYFVYGETLTVRKDAIYANLDALRGHRVGTLNQTVAHDLLKTKPVDIVLYEGQEEPYFDLAAGRTDAVLLDHVIADRYGCIRPALRCLPEDVTRGHYVLGIGRSHVRLKQAIDRAIGEMRADGELRRILSAWKLWDARQETLEPAPANPPAEPRAEPTPVSSRRLDLWQLQLFARGALMTLLLSVASFALAFPIGIVTAILRLYSGKLGRSLATVYVEVFRGTPLLLQLYVLYFGISGLVRLSPLTAAILGLGLNYGAYEAEVQRGALRAIARGQTEAARALGLGRWQTLRYVLLPQSLKNALPAVTNDFVALLKDSSLVSVITVVELTKRMTIVAVELRDWVTPGLLCAGLYFLLSFPLAELARRLERRLEHDQHPQLA